MAGVAAGPLEFPSPQGPIPITAILISSGKAGVLAERVEVNYPEAGVLLPALRQRPGLLDSGHRDGRA